MNPPTASPQLVQAWQERLASLQALTVTGGSAELLALWNLRVRLFTFLLARYGQPVQTSAIADRQTRAGAVPLPVDRAVPVTSPTPPSLAASVRSRHPLAHKLASLRQSNQERYRGYQEEVRLGQIREIERQMRANRVPVAARYDSIARQLSYIAEPGCGERRLSDDLVIEQDSILAAAAQDIESLDDLLAPNPEGTASEEQILRFLD